jgi:hypothetical protein
VPAGHLGLEYAADLLLDDGRLGTGNGYEGAVAGGRVLAITSPGTSAPVTLAVFENAQVGQRVAFVEARLAPGVPVRWAQEVLLNIVTDGGDGGFYAGSAPYPDVDDENSDAFINSYVDALFPRGDVDNVCALRTPAGSSRPDSVLFPTGYGDGRYPTFVGRDAHGTPVSVVLDTLILPWQASGLPGTPPR